MLANLPQRSNNLRTANAWFKFALFSFAMAFIMIQQRFFSNNADEQQPYNFDIKPDEVAWPSKRLRDYTRLTVNALAIYYDPKKQNWYPNSRPILYHVVENVLHEKKLATDLCKEIVKNPLTKNLFYAAYNQEDAGSIFQFQLKPGPIFAIAARLSEKSPIDPGLLKNAHEPHIRVPGRLVHQALARAIEQEKKQNTTNLLETRFIDDENDLADALHQGKLDWYIGTGAALCIVTGMVALHRTVELVNENRQDPALRRARYRHRFDR